MTAIISILLYLFILFGFSTLLFFSFQMIWETNEPIIVYLLSLIFIYLILNTIGKITNQDK